MTTRPAVVVPVLAVMVLLIVGLDIAMFRDHPWLRLMANVGIVLVAGAVALRFGRQPG